MPSVAIRLRPFFSPADNRLSSLLPPFAAAALAVASRSASGLITTPLPSTDSTSTVAFVHGAGTSAS